MGGTGCGVPKMRWACVAASKRDFPRGAILSDDSVPVDSVVGGFFKTVVRSLIAAAGSVW